MTKPTKPPPNGLRSHLAGLPLAAITLLGLPLILTVNGLFTQLVGPRIETVAFAYGAIKDVTLAVLVAWVFLSGRWRALPGPIVGFAVGFAVFGLLSAWAASSVQGAAYGWRNNYLPALILLPAAIIFSTALFRRWFVLMVAAAVNVAGLVTVASWAAGVRWLLELGILPPSEGQPFPTSYFSSGSLRPRGFSPWVAPNEAGVFLVIALALIWTARPGLSWRARAGLSAVPTAAIVVTHSRSAWLGLACLGTIMVLHLADRRWGSRAAIASGVACACAVAVGAVAYLRERGGIGADPSLGGHFDSLRRTLGLIAREPFGLGLGDVGPRSLRFAEQSVLVESYFLLIAVEAGVLALIALLGLVLSVFWACALRSDRAALMSAAVVAAAGVSQAVLPTFQEGSVSYLYWLSLGVALGAALEARTPKRVIGQRDRGNHSRRRLRR